MCTIRIRSKTKWNDLFIKIFTKILIVLLFLVLKLSFIRLTSTRLHFIYSSKHSWNHVFLAHTQLTSTFSPFLFFFTNTSRVYQASKNHFFKSTYIYISSTFSCKNVINHHDSATRAIRKDSSFELFSYLLFYLFYHFY